MQDTIEERATKFLSALDTAEEECFKARDESLKRIIAIKRGMINLKQSIPQKVIVELEGNIHATNLNSVRFGIPATELDPEDMIQYLRILKYKSFLIELETHKFALRTYDKVLLTLLKLNF